MQNALNIAENGFRSFFPIKKVDYNLKDAISMFSLKMHFLRMIWQLEETTMEEFFTR